MDTPVLVAIIGGGVAIIGGLTAVIVTIAAKNKNNKKEK